MLTCLPPQTLLRLAMDVCGSVGTALFAVLVGTGIYWLIIYKGQGSAGTLPPTSEQSRSFITVVIVAFAFKALEVAGVVRRQTVGDVFFIDWERGTSATGHPGIKGHGVAWRLLFVANEWAELQTHRCVVRRRNGKRGGCERVRDEGCV